MNRAFRENRILCIAVLAVTLFVVMALEADGAEHLLFTGSSDQLAAGQEDQYLVSSQALRFRKVNLNPALKSPTHITKGDRLILGLFDETTYTANIDRVVSNVNGTVSVRGRINGCPSSYVLISTTGERSLGSICVPEKGQRYIIQSGPDGMTHYLVELDVKKLDELEDSPSLIPPITVRGTYKGFESIPLGGPLDPALIDVMVVYTPAARQWADDNSSGIANVIAQAMEKGQLALDNSSTILTITLVRSAEVNYTESGSSNTDLDRLTNTSDGYMDDVHTWRDQYGADIVGLFTKVEDTGGLGWLLNITSGQPTYAFSITRVQQASWTYTYIHEMGHNMGCHHRKDQATEPGPGLFNYSAGWHWIGNDSGKYCSVMSYEDGGYSTVAYFSNPDILYQGVATGHPADGDNVRTIRKTKQVIAAYRQSYTLSLSKTGSGSVSVNGTLRSLPWSGTFGAGTNVTLEAVSDSGWWFSGWSGDLSGSTNPTSIQMNGNKSVTANFIQPTYTLSLSRSGNGSVVVNGIPRSLPWSGTFTSGTNVTLEAVPDSGWQFANWSGDLSGSTNPTSIQMNGNRSVTANFQFLFGGGSGTQANPFQISTVSHWQNLMNTPADWDKYFILTADLDLQGITLSPIGNDSQPFNGVFDGNGYVIRNAVVNMPDSDYVGLFGWLGYDGQLRNLCGEDVVITGYYFVGGLVGVNEGSLTACSATGTVSGYYWVGGLVGFNESILAACYATGSVSGGFWVGGLVGGNYEGTISNCYSTGSVTGGAIPVGGLVGWNDYGSVTACFWDVNTSGWTTSAGGVGKTTTQMKDPNTFISAGWDFVNIWDICEGTNYPRFVWQIPAADWVCPDGVGFEDFSHLADGWQMEFGINDLMLFCEQWLTGR